MRKLVTIAFLLFLLTNLQGQTDLKAVKILDHFSETATSAPSVTINFVLLTVNQVEKTQDSSAGSVIISRNQYNLELPDNIIWFDGTTSWSYLKAEKEVTITRPDKKDDSFLGKPSSIFTLYKKGYKTRLIEENGTASVIDLYPNDIKSELVRIRLALVKNGTELQEAEYKRKDGITVYLKVKEYNLKKKPDSGSFVFDPAKYKGVEIVDMR
jgi:outer membrane lipoprotein carrier protein